MVVKEQVFICLACSKYTYKLKTVLLLVLCKLQREKPNHFHFFLIVLTYTRKKLLFLHEWKEKNTNKYKRKESISSNFPVSSFCLFFYNQEDCVIVSNFISISMHTNKLTGEQIPRKGTKRKKMFFKQPANSIKKEILVLCSPYSCLLTQT